MEESGRGRRKGPGVGRVISLPRGTRSFRSCISRRQRGWEANAFAYIIPHVSRWGVLTGVTREIVFSENCWRNAHCFRVDGASGFALSSLDMEAGGGGGEDMRNLLLELKDPWGECLLFFLIYPLSSFFSSCPRRFIRSFLVLTFWRYRSSLVVAVACNGGRPGFGASRSPERARDF